MEDMAAQFQLSGKNNPFCNYSHVRFHSKIEDIGFHIGVLMEGYEDLAPKSNKFLSNKQKNIACTLSI